MVRGTQGARCWVGLLGLAAVVLGGCVTGQQDQDKASAYERIDSGIVVSPASGPAKRVRLQVMSDRIVRVTAAPQEMLPGETLNVPASLMVTATPSNDAEFTVEERDGFVVLKTARVQAEVSTESGAVRFLDDQGRPILAEHERALGIRRRASVDPQTLADSLELCGLAEIRLGRYTSARQRLHLPKRIPPKPCAWWCPGPPAARTTSLRASWRRSSPS